MKTSSNRFLWFWAHRFRRVFGKSFSGFFKVGKIIQVLWDAAMLQKQQQGHKIQIGERAIDLVRSGQLKNLQLERLIARIDRSERLLKRQEMQLASFLQKKNQSIPEEAYKDVNNNELESV